jgi:hypothetical protein
MAEVRGDQAVKARLVVSGNANFEKGMKSPYLEVIDQKSKGTAGGEFTGGNIYRTRDLNTVIFNDFAVAIFSGNTNLEEEFTGEEGANPDPVAGAGGDITLPAGLYYVEIMTPAMNVNEHMSRLADVTDNPGQAGSTVVLGTSEFSADTAIWRTGDGTHAAEAMTIASASQTRSIITGRFELTAQRTLEIQHRCSNTQPTDGFGSDANFYDTNNVFTVMKMWQIRDGTTV